MRVCWFVLVTLFLLLACLNLQLSEALVQTWKSKEGHHEDSFHIPTDSMFVSSPVTNTTLRRLEQYKTAFRNKSLDERCRLGLPLSIAWHNSPPYVNFHQSTFRGKKGLTVSGMFPNILKVAIQACCHPNSTVTHGKFVKSVRHAEDDIDTNLFDFVFPIYGQERQMEFREHSYINVVVAPRVILLSMDQQGSSRTQVLFQTIMRAWPMLIFILVTACLSGVIIWFLDHSMNPDEFPPPFLRGAWEGFWWALVTMTTVGYGDRSPKSGLGRLFCIMWILTGIVIVSIFTALVTASLSASTVQQFTVHGSKIGAINGSQEYQLGVTMNAQLEVFPLVMKITEALLKNQIDGALVDNYVVTSNLHHVKNTGIRVQRYIDHKIPYGVVLAENSSRLDKCIRSFLRDHPQEVFEKIASNLVPLNNPIDYENHMLKAAEGLFYEEDLFNWIMYIGLGGAVACFVAGLIWEFAYRRPRLGNPTCNPKSSYSANDETVKLHPSDKSEEGQLDDMISEYQVFHDAWIEKLKKMRDKNCNLESNDATV